MSASDVVLAWGLVVTVCGLGLIVTKTNPDRGWQIVIIGMLMCVLANQAHIRWGR